MRRPARRVDGVNAAMASGWGPVESVAAATARPDAVDALRRREREAHRAIDGRATPQRGHAQVRVALPQPHRDVARRERGDAPAAGAGKPRARGRARRAGRERLRRQPLRQPRPDHDLVPAPRPSRCLRVRSRRWRPGSARRRRRRGLPWTRAQRRLESVAAMAMVWALGRSAPPPRRSSWRVDGVVA